MGPQERGEKAVSQTSRVEKQKKQSLEFQLKAGPLNGPLSFIEPSVGFPDHQELILRALGSASSLGLCYCFANLAKATIFKSTHFHSQTP